MLTTLIIPVLLQVGPNPALVPPPAVPEELVEQRYRKFRAMTVVEEPR